MPISQILLLILVGILCLVLGAIAGALIAHNNGKTMGALLAKVEYLEGSAKAAVAEAITKVPADIVKADLAEFMDRLEAGVRARLDGKASTSTTPPSAT